MNDVTEVNQIARWIKVTLGSDGELGYQMGITVYFKRNETVYCTILRYFDYCLPFNMPFGGVDTPFHPD